MMNSKNLGRVARIALAAAALMGAQWASAEVKTGDYIKLSTSPNGTLAGAFSGIEIKSNGSAMSGEKSFYTFCLEQYETFSPGATLYVGNVSNQTVNASTSNTYYTKNNGANNVASGGTKTTDPLSAQTEWLFTQFSTVNSFKTTVLASNTSANSFQRAVWYLENELAWNSTTKQDNADYFADAFAKQLVDQATIAVNNGWTDAKDQVRVLNLYSKDSRSTYTKHAQDQLYFVSAVPEPETYALMLAGLGLVGAVARRRKAKAAAV